MRGTRGTHDLCLVKNHSDLGHPPVSTYTENANPRCWSKIRSAKEATADLSTRPSAAADGLAQDDKMWVAWGSWFPTLRQKKGEGWGTQCQQVRLLPPAPGPPATHIVMRTREKTRVGHLPPGSLRFVDSQVAQMRGTWGNQLLGLG